MTLTVNGHDITPYIAARGLQRTRRDVTSELVTMDGVTHRAIISSKTDLTITLQTMDESTLRTVLGWFEGTGINVSYSDIVNGNMELTMMLDGYTNGIAVVVGNAAYWDGATIALREC